ncbi:hypothetical protein HYPSUDRAFT_299779 [Hypholoma sublateritium FD-334 SS-4]|uniref:Uncharacterized protein n=1 Tax=Hypholoma sublateritium (strain FD-334 SS-4) TaxID=945553 RepID=A0A0D2NI08_HYPSF|nr:hypothetical protein HYPSUDRAFT_299779 [Hypholoma sublateritium FD-334 SS-4]
MLRVAHLNSISLPWYSPSRHLFHYACYNAQPCLANLELRYFTDILIHAHIISHFAAPLECSASFALLLRTEIPSRISSLKYSLATVILLIVVFLASHEDILPGYEIERILNHCAWREFLLGNLEAMYGIFRRLLHLRIGLYKHAMYKWHISLPFRWLRGVDMKQLQSVSHRYRTAEDGFSMCIGASAGQA